MFLRYSERFGWSGFALAIQKEHYLRGCSRWMAAFEPMSICIPLHVLHWHIFKRLRGFCTIILSNPRLCLTYMGGSEDQKTKVEDRQQLVCAQQIDDHRGTSKECRNHAFVFIVLTCLSRLLTLTSCFLWSAVFIGLLCPYELLFILLGVHWFAKKMLENSWCSSSFPLCSVMISKNQWNDLQFEFK